MKDSTDKPDVSTIVAYVVALTVFAALTGGAYWLVHPPLSVNSEGTWVFMALAFALLFLALLAANQFVSYRSDRYYGYLDRHKYHGVAGVATLGALLLAGGTFVVMLLCMLGSAPIFFGNAERYATVLATEDGVFADDIKEVDYEDVPVIDRDSAELLGNRAMGSISEYVSQFEIADTYSQISYQGRPVRVSTLVYADFFKWFSNQEDGIPAYVIVDMVTQDANVVRLDESIRYSDSELFGRDVDRYTQLSYPTYMFDQKSFELDEDGHPWWVYPIQTKTIGLFGGTDVSGVVLVDACTGETREYAIGDVPEWVDRAYPADLLIEQYNWSGAYKSGFLNSIFGQEGVVSTTRGTDENYGYNYIAQDGDIYMYTGVTSVTADNSIIGFILVNQRTGESKFYSVSGATEASAMSSAEGELQNMKYTATFPLLLNVAGQPTYFVSMKDGAGLVKMHAMINVEQYQNVATGDTVAECQESYLSQMASDGVLSSDEVAESAVYEDASGAIASIGQAVVDGNTHFYVTLDGSPSVYDFVMPDMFPIMTYSVGDTISFTYASDADANGTYAVKTVTAKDGTVYPLSDAGEQGDDTVDGDAGQAQQDAGEQQG